MEDSLFGLSEASGLCLSKKQRVLSGVSLLQKDADHLDDTLSYSDFILLHYLLTRLFKLLLQFHQLGLDRVSKDAREPVLKVVKTSKKSHGSLLFG